MKGAIISLATVGTVVAQLTAAPELFNVAAVNVNDDEFTTCSVVADYVGQCVTALGGSDALATADPDAILSCACCVSSTAVYPLYSACSSYLDEEGGTTYTDQVSAYSVIYSACDASAACGAGSNDFTTEPTATSTEDVFDNSATITSAASQTYATACEDMIGMFTSCTNKIDDFTDLPFREQASCYCCATRGGTLSWNDALDRYASTCAEWAVTGEPETAYKVAETFASFCSKFSTVCDDATITSDSTSATATDDSSSDSSSDDSSDDSSNTDPVTITVPPSAAATEDSAGVALRVSCAAVLGAVAAVAFAL